MMNRVKYCFLLVTAVSVVFLWIVALTVKPSTHVHSTIKVEKYVTGQTTSDYSTTEGKTEEAQVEETDKPLDDDTVFVDNAVAKETLSKIKVFCWITTQEKELKNKIPAVNHTWARRCDHKMFIMTTNKQYPGKQIVNLNIKDGRAHLTEKTIAAWKYIHKHHLDDYDWFLKTDDDTYIIMENLKYLLSHYKATEGIYIGHLFKKFSRWGYMSGGAGYVLSRQAVRLLVEQGYHKNSTCKKVGKDEDVEVGDCLHKVGIPVHNTLDRFGRETFHPFSAHQHLTGSLPALLPQWERNPIRKGDDCCSQLTISYHYVDPKMMRTIEFLLYKTTVFGRKVEPKHFTDFFQIGVVPSLPPSKSTTTVPSLSPPKSKLTKSTK